MDDISLTQVVSAEDTDIHIRINNEPFVAPSRVMSGAELIALAKAPVGNHLFLEVEGPGPDRPIRPEEEVPLHTGMKFYDVPVGTFG